MSSSAASRPLRAAVALASAGRPQLLADAVRNLELQTTTDFVRIVSVPDEASLPDDDSLSGWTIVTGARGLALQRNAALDAIAGLDPTPGLEGVPGAAVRAAVDVVFFFDDDAVVRPDYLAAALAFFAGHPEVIGLTGRVLIDGAVSGEVTVDRADRALADSLRRPSTGAWRVTRELYGCNFAVRVAPSAGLRFDGRLPLYSWLEDHDFARRLMRLGVLAEVDDAVIVHRAASSGGRQAHTRLGYSQMMNPIYIWRKGTFPAWLAVREIFRPTSKNLVFSIVGPQSRWRRERLRGNLIALGDALRGRITPERITRL
ncbi:MAG: hypothetical protein RI885_1118 [Actinomycetota bacterium]